MQDPAAAAVETERCVKELGFVGVLVNGYSNIGSATDVQYLDEPQCEPFWAKLQELDVPLYLHLRILPPHLKKM
jgi:gamma-resorcylate decarboxylase